MLRLRWDVFDPQMPERTALEEQLRLLVPALDVHCDVLPKSSDALPEQVFPN